MSISNVIVLGMTLLLGIPVLWFCIQIAMALLPSRTASRQHSPIEIITVVLVPAHNESNNLIPTLQALLAEKTESLRVLVVADNCTDDTAEIAQREGAEVIERTHADLRGKGYALDFGIQSLQNNPPQVLIILDADCLPESGALTKLANLAIATSRPVQALYLMSHKNSPGLRAKIAEFAWLVKNQVRPRGLHRMGLPCHLTGSGMAFPWGVLQQVSLATGSIVEDMKLGMELTAQGHPILFSEHTLVRSTFPTHEEGVRSQRTRWEHGHLSMLLQEGLPKMLQGIRHRRPSLFFLALDLCIPPLALLVMFVCGWLLTSALYWIGSGNPVPFTLGVGYLLFISACVVLAWLKYGRQVVSGLELLMAPMYVLGKLPIYVGYLFRRQAQWVRSKRDNETK